MNKAAILGQALSVRFAALGLAVACWTSGLPCEEPTPEQRGLLVVAPHKFRGQLRRYARERSRSIPTRLASLEAILATSKGVDYPERLKRFLYEQWRTSGIGYVLLVGDGDVLPVRYFTVDRTAKAPFNYGFLVSDLYYADLADEEGDFEDWNGDKMGFHAAYFGEVGGVRKAGDPINRDGIDYRPEIGLGRWPVSNRQELERIARKTLDYVRRERRRGGRGSAALISVAGWTDSRGYLDTAAKALEAGMKVERRYFADKKRDDGTLPPTQTELLNLFGEGVDLVFHAGHGTGTSWHKCFSTRAVGRLKNRTRLPIILSVGCSTGRFVSAAPYRPYLDVNGKRHRGRDFGERFEAPPIPPAPFQTGDLDLSGLGEKLLFAPSGGAVAYIGCNTGSQPCSLHLMEEFARACRKLPVPRLGDCWAEAVRAYHARRKLTKIVSKGGWYRSAIFYQAMKFLVFGDPSIRIAYRRQDDSGR